MVTQQFNIGWEHVMSGVHSIIVVYIDIRGSGGRGLQWQRGIHGNIRQTAVVDILTAIG